MNSASLSLPLSLAGWFWLPNIVTRQLLALYHRFLVSHYGSTAVPVPGTAQWQRHYRVAYGTAVLGYLTYNLVEAARGAPPNLFQVLGVTPDADATLLKNAYRAFAKRYHPDRAGPASEAHFIAIRDAYEALKDPVKRFAYERFGLDALKWKDCSTPKEYIWRGLLQSSGFYITSGVVLVFMSLFTRASPVAFWRYMLYLAMLACELCLVLGHESPILNMLLPDQVAYQLVLGLHQLFVFLSMALSRIVPVVFPEPMVINEKDPRTYKPFLERIQQSLQILNLETQQQLNHEFRVLSGDASLANAEAGPSKQPTIAKRPELSPDVSESLFKELEDLVLEQLIRVEPPLRQLWDAAVLREREREKRTPKADAIALALDVPMLLKGMGSDNIFSKARAPVSPISPEGRIGNLPPLGTPIGEPNGNLDKGEPGEVAAAPLSPRPSPSPPPPNLRRLSGSPRKAEERQQDVAQE